MTPALKYVFKLLTLSELKGGAFQVFFREVFLPALEFLGADFSGGSSLPAQGGHSWAGKRDQVIFALEESCLKEQNANRGWAAGRKCLYFLF